MLEIKNLSKNFELNDHKVLDKLDFSVHDGEFVCVLGPSGCGKTVLLYLIAGFLKQTSGEILLDEQVIDSPSPERIMLFQDYVLYPWKTVFGNIFFGLEKTKLSQQEKEILAKKYLELVDLVKYKDWYPYALSGGMKQRVALARALISNPKILLMDEPFSALDSQYRRYMRESLEQILLKTKTPVVFVTHSVGEAVYLADTIHILSHLPARIIKTYKIDMPRPRKPRSAEFSNIVKNIEEITNIEFKKSIEENPNIYQAVNNIVNELIQTS